MPDEKKKVLAQLEPAEVFNRFEELSGVPRGSGNTGAVSDHLAAFAKEHGLFYVQDKAGNVLIKKDATPGREGLSPVIIQGHMDMVCVADEGVEKDFTKEGIDLVYEDGVISARGTSLGGDDGIAVAFGLALLESKTIPHPPLEVLFTVDEEIGMLGATAFDGELIKGRRLLNIDSEHEGVLTVGCAGGVTAKAGLPVQKTAADDTAYTGTLSITGLAGGHSGMEIIKGGANACVLLGRALYELSKTAEENGFTMLAGSLTGGTKDNAIPVSACAKIALTGKDAAASKEAGRLAEETIGRLSKTFLNEYGNTDPGLKAEFKCEECKELMDRESTMRAVSLLRLMPWGVRRMSTDIEGLVQTSLNPGILREDEKSVTVTFSVRSSVTTEKYELTERLGVLADLLGGSVTFEGDYPAWEYRKDSPLRDLMVSCFKERYGKEPVIESVHAGLECGIFAGKLDGLDAVSFGPDLKNIHTTGESMDAASVQRTWKYLLDVLEKME